MAIHHFGILNPPTPTKPKKKKFHVMLSITLGQIRKAQKALLPFWDQRKAIHHIHILLFHLFRYLPNILLQEKPDREFPFYYREFHADAGRLALLARHEQL